MRILHITDDISTEASGISSYLKNLLPLLESENVETYLYSPPSTGARFESHLSRWASRRHYQEVRRLLCTQKPAIVHAHSLSLRLSPLVLRAAREASVPVVATVHDFNYVCPGNGCKEPGARYARAALDWVVWFATARQSGAAGITSRTRMPAG